MRTSPRRILRAAVSNGRAKASHGILASHGAARPSHPRTGRIPTPGAPESPARCARPLPRISGSRCARDWRSSVSVRTLDGTGARAVPAPVGHPPGHPLGHTRACPVRVSCARVPCVFFAWPCACVMPAERDDAVPAQRADEDVH
jgi:hypothetical protein